MCSKIRCDGYCAIFFHKLNAPWNCAVNLNNRSHNPCCGVNLIRGVPPAHTSTARAGWRLVGAASAGASHGGIFWREGAEARCPTNRTSDKKNRKTGSGYSRWYCTPHQVTTVRRREEDEIRRLIGCWLRLVDQAKAWDWLFFWRFLESPLWLSWVLYLQLQ